MLFSSHKYWYELCGNFPPTLTQRKVRMATSFNRISEQIRSPAPATLTLAAGVIPNQTPSNQPSNLRQSAASHAAFVWLVCLCWHNCFVCVQGACPSSGTLLLHVTPWASLFFCFDTTLPCLVSIAIAMSPKLFNKMKAQAKNAFYCHAPFVGSLSRRC